MLARVARASRRQPTPNLLSALSPHPIQIQRGEALPHQIQRGEALPHRTSAPPLCLLQPFGRRAGAIPVTLALERRCYGCCRLACSPARH